MADDDPPLPSTYKLRSFLFDFLKRQRVADEAFFWIFVDGLMIGRLPDSELHLLVSYAREKTDADEVRAAHPAPRGRPATGRLLPHLDPQLNGSLRFEYAQLCDTFRDFAATRRTYHATKRYKRAAARARRDRPPCESSQLHRRASVFAAYSVWGGG